MNMYLRVERGLFIFMTVIICLYVNAQPKWVKVTNKDCTYFEPYYEDGFSATWNGDVINGKANGLGSLEKYQNGKKFGIYQGSIVNGQIQGNASYTVFFDNGIKRVFNGIFESGELIGEGSRIDYLPNGDSSVYNGSLVNYIMHGKGSIKFADGSSFEGLFYMNQPFTGKFYDTNKNTIWIYQGSRVEKMPKLPNSNYLPQLGIQQTEYFDEKWNRCDLKSAKYYRLITYKAPNRPQGIVRDYYMSGKLQSEFECSFIDYNEDHLNFSIGESKWYHENGQLSRICNHKNNVIIGEDKHFYENGKSASTITYDKNGVIISQRTWHKSGKPNIIADFQNGRLINDRYTEYDENGLACQVMQEIFDLNKQTWEVEDESAKSEIISNNILMFTGKKESTSIRINYISIDQSQNFSIEGAVDLLDEKENASGYGLIIGFKDWANYLFFIISGKDGLYKIQNTYEGVNVPIRDWNYSSAINKGRSQNILKMMKIGEKMIFSINGTVIEQIDAQPLRGGELWDDNWWEG